MKRYLLFAGKDYYPYGGASDLVGSFDSLSEAMNATPTDGGRRHLIWAHVLDTEDDTVHECNDDALKQYIDRWGTHLTLIEGDE